MGAHLATQRAEGKDAREAYHAANAAAADEYGHQQGYSGAINSKDGGFVEIPLPPRMTPTQLIELLEDGQDYGEWLRESIGINERLIRQHARKHWPARAQVQRDLKREKAELAKIVREQKRRDDKLRKAGISSYDFDRWVEIFHDKWGAPLCVQTKDKAAKRGNRVFLFFGYAPS